jgi:hypothetical protein
MIGGVLEMPTVFFSFPELLGEVSISVGSEMSWLVKVIVLLVVCIVIMLSSDAPELLVWLAA